MASDRPYGLVQKSDRKSERPRLPATAPCFMKCKSDMISYEDLLVAQYLDEIKRQKNATPRRENQQASVSPYLQKLPHTHLRFGKLRRRPMSAGVTFHPGSTKPKIDAKFIADENLWDAESPRQRKVFRPASAPVRRLRPPSGRSFRSRPGSGRRAIFQKQPSMMKVFAFKNGSRDNFIHVTAPTIKILLEMVTEKLFMPFAARRVFLEDGIEIFHENDVPANGDIYISMGENYKDPFRTTKRSMIARNKSMWTLSGIVLPEAGRQKQSRTRLSKRMKSLCENKRVRILIFKNGNGTEPTEVVADINDLSSFFAACTGKLDLRSHAKIAYDWQMSEITDLGEVPVLHESIAQQGKTPVLGPLWLSTGEPCRPSGPYLFLRKMLKPRIKSRLKRDKQFRSEVKSAIEKDKNNVTILELLSMSSEELESSLTKVEEDIYMGEEDLKEVNEKINSLSGPAREEEEQGSKFCMSHIQELSTDDRLVGTHGIKLKVFENGKCFDEFSFFFNLREATKGLGKQMNAKEQLLKRLLDEISNTRFASGSTNRNLSSVIQKLYNEFGHEIKDPSKLEQEQVVWMSFGEPFICPFTYCLQVNVDKATKLRVHDSDNNDVIVRENLEPTFDELTKESNKWEASIGFPALYDDSAMPEEEYLEAYNQDRVDHLMTYSKIDYRTHYLLLKDSNNIALYPELCFADKTSSKCQTFMITESGCIYSKAFPQMCLGVSDKRLETRLFDKGIPLEGFAVTLQKRMEGNPGQIWRFSVNTTISSDAYPHLLLTYLGNKYGDEETYLANTPQGGTVGERFYLVVADELPKKEAAAQRFGIKQERFDQIGQWRYTDFTNNEFNKLAYSWPVTRDGSLNKKYLWPMEGLIISHVPPVHKRYSHSMSLPARLMVLKNGDREENNAVYIVGPNMANMMKDNERKNHASKTNKKNKKKFSQMLEDEPEEEMYLHCLNLDVRWIELQMFLDHCTSILQLPFAARRLFDAKGSEIFSLVDLERDQIVFVTCGETWQDPKLTRKEQKRRYELSRLTSDVNKIKQFCSLRNPEGLVLEINGPLSQGSPVIINYQWNRDEDFRHDRGDGMSTKRSIDQQQQSLLLLQEDQEQQATEDSSKDETKMTAHEIAHLKSEERLNNLKWPWEKLVNVNNSMDNDDPEAHKYTDKDMYEKYKPQTSPRISRDTLQKFTFEDGYIALVTNRTLVLAMAEDEGRVVEVILAKRRPDDINQQWIVRENGEIRPRGNAHLVMTVGLPAMQGDQTVVSLSACPVNLQARRTNTFGKAHQRWRYDAETGFIHSFSAELPDKEITAANRADVCTYAIAQSADIDQPGYLLEYPYRDGISEHKVCVSCARGMRGRYKMQRLPPNTNFHCAMGDAKKLKIPHVGSFAVLNNKVDLSTFEADITLEYWTDILEVLRKQTSVQTISKEINAARSVRTVKVMAYKNGEGRLRKGETICGSSVQGILCQSNHRLGMSNAPRRLYLEDGSLILDVEDLVNHAIENCKIEMVNMLLLNKEKGINFDQDNQELEEEDEAVRLKRLQAAANEEISNQLRRSLELMSSGDGPQEKEERGGQRGRGLEEGDEDDSSEQQEDNSEQRDVDNEEAVKIRRERDELLKDIKLPPLDIILRAPIEVWISSGKSFVPPEVVESKEENRHKKRQFRAQVCLALDIDKHVLRQMKGRRLEKMEPGKYKSTLSCKQPVVIEKTWQEPTVEEQDKHHSVHKLQTHLGEIKANQQDENKGYVGVNLEGKLYMQPNMKRIMVYPNGETMERCVYIWGETIHELLENATMKLGLWKNAKIFYHLNGIKVEDFDDIQRDQLLCVSTGRPFSQPTNQKVNVEIKANWGRARKQYGNKATDVVVDVKKNPQVDVDPFGPPLLALPLK